MNTTISGSGPNENTDAQVDLYHQALRVSQRPWAHDGGGHYKFFARSGALTGAAIVAGAPLFSFRWASDSKLCALLRLQAWYVPTVVFTAEQELGLDLIRSTAYSAADSTGTTVVPQSTRTTMTPSSATDVRIAGTTLLTAGSRVLDANAMDGGGGLVNVKNAAAGTAYVNPNSGGGPAFGFDYDPLLRGECPLILGQNNGFHIRNTVIFPAAGTCVLIVKASIVEWLAAAPIIPNG